MPNRIALSLIVATYNRGPKIAPTLDSVLAQTVRPDEILVVDDGSDAANFWGFAVWPEHAFHLRSRNGHTGDA